jgi:hypothetical protein
MLDRLHRRLAASARTRRCRCRQRDGKAVALIEYDHRVVDLLVKLHWLEEAEAFDRRKIGQAITTMLADAAG